MCLVWTINLSNLNLNRKKDKTMKSRNMHQHEHICFKLIKTRQNICFNSNMLWEAAAQSGNPQVCCYFISFREEVIYERTPCQIKSAGVNRYLWKEDWKVNRYQTLLCIQYNQAVPEMLTERIAGVTAEGELTVWWLSTHNQHCGIVTRLTLFGLELLAFWTSSWITCKTPQAATQTELQDRQNHPRIYICVAHEHVLCFHTHVGVHMW